MHGEGHNIREETGGSLLKVGILVPQQVCSLKKITLIQGVSLSSGPTGAWKMVKTFREIIFLNVLLAFKDLGPSKNKFFLSVFL